MLHPITCELNWTAKSRPSYTTRSLVTPIHVRQRHATWSWLAAAKLGRLVLSEFWTHVVQSGCSFTLQSLQFPDWTSVQFSSVLRCELTIVPELVFRTRVQLSSVQCCEQAFRSPDYHIPHYVHSSNIHDMLSNTPQLANCSLHRYAWYKMWLIVTVGLSVSCSRLWALPPETAEPIKMPFGMWNRMSPRKRVLSKGLGAIREGAI